MARIFFGPEFGGGQRLFPPVKKPVKRLIFPSIFPIPQCHLNGINSEKTLNWEFEMHFLRENSQLDYS